MKRIHALKIFGQKASYIAAPKLSYDYEEKLDRQSRWSSLNYIQRKHLFKQALVFFVLYFVSLYSKEMFIFSNITLQ